MTRHTVLRSLSASLAIAIACCSAQAATAPVSTSAAPLKAAPAKTAPAKAAPAPTLPSLTAAQVVDKNVAARGGLAAWQAVQTMTWKGKLGAGGTRYAVVTPKGQLQTKEHEETLLPFTLDFKRPLKSRLELEFNGQTAVQVFDGASGWKLRPYLNRSDWDAFTPEELRQAAMEPGIDGLLINYTAKGAKVESAGTESVEGHAAYKLKVTRKDGQVRYVWVDGQSFLDLKVDGEPRRLDGKMRSVAVYLRDFRRDEGLMIPHVQETVVQGVNSPERISIDTVIVNPKLDDLLFTKGA